MIRVSHVPLPPGLSALAHRGPDGELTVFVSDGLPADRQRAAVRAALRAARRPGWRTALPAPSAVLLAFTAGWLRRAARLLRAHPVAWGTAAAAATLAAVTVYLGAAPHPHGPASLPGPVPPGTSQPAEPSPAAPSRPARHPRSRHRSPLPGSSGPAQVAPMTTMPAQPLPVPGTPPVSSPPPGSPSPGASSPVPVPPSSPAPVPSGHRACLRLAGIRLCLGISL
jgi:hypothetical protein